MPDAISVGGLHRSGTTVVHFLLGAHPHCVAIGEAWGFISSKASIERADEIGCSCGAPASECSFWGPLVPKLAGDGDYAPVFERAREVYGDAILVDSSKSLAARRALEGDVFRLHVIRDVRAWAVSTERVNWRGMRAWHRQNRRMIDAGSDMVVSYDELALRPEATLNAICENIGLEADIPSMLRFGAAEHHAVKCNRMKGDPNKMAGLVYDNRWFTDDRWLRPAMLSPVVMRFNKRQVYGHAPSIF
ncbi:MAG: hypothetical protein AAF515_05635 [Pseudomonadota bacterium]